MMNMAFDLYQAVNGEIPVTFEVRMLSIEPTDYDDIAHFTEPTFSGYGASPLSDIVSSTLSSVGMSRVVGNATFTYAGPDATTTAWGFFITAEYQHQKYLCDVIPFDPPINGVISIGIWQWQISMVVTQIFATGG